jgi:hypothetical protein
VQGGQGLGARDLLIGAGLRVVETLGRGLFDQDLQLGLPGRPEAALLQGGAGGATSGRASAASATSRSSRVPTTTTSACPSSSPVNTATATAGVRRQSTACTPRTQAMPWSANAASAAWTVRPAAGRPPVMGCVPRLIRA